MHIPLKKDEIDAIKYGGLLPSETNPFKTYNSDVNDIITNDSVNGIGSDQFYMTPVVSTFAELSGPYKWAGGVLAPNGKIYGIPHLANYIIEIDIDNQSVIHFGTLPETYKWYGGVLASNGKIYSMPYGTNMDILEIDPDTQSIRTIQVQSEANYNIIGCTAHPNGKIYSFLGSENKLIEFDPITEIVRTIDTSFQFSSYVGSSIVGLNNRIYTCLGYENSVIEFDVATENFRSIEIPKTHTTSNMRYSNFVLATNGKLYSFPSTDAYDILEVDTVNFTYKLIPVTNSSNNYSFCVLGSNKKIYGTNKNSQILEFDPFTYEQKTFTLTPIFNAWIAVGAILAPNGVIYTIPYSSPNIYKIDIKCIPNDPNACLSLYYNKL